MTSILFKLAVFSTLVTAIATTIALMPDAGPLPPAIGEFILWILPKLYYIDEIFPIDTFLAVVGYVINSFIAFLSLVALKKIINTTIASAS